MSFGKSNQPRKRHRPKKVVEVDEDAVQEKREEKMNSQRIPMLISVFGSIAMLGIVVTAAPYSYGSGVVHYNTENVRKARDLASLGSKLTPEQREEAGDKLLIDFTDVMVPPDLMVSAAAKNAAQTCRQARASKLKTIIPDDVHSVFGKATKYMTCIMATQRQRFCDAGERAVLVEQLMAYKERRQNVLGFEKYRDREVRNWDEYRDFQREQGEPDPGPLKITDVKIDEDLDPAFLAQMEFLMRNGYLSAKDFGYYGLYVPGEYADILRLGADRYAPCPART